MMESQQTIKYGSVEVPVVRRQWPVVQRIPYRKTYSLKPGQKWAEAKVTAKQWEAYVVEQGGTYLPVGAKIAKELIEEGAEQAVFVELWGSKCVIVDHTLTCVEPTGRIREILEMVRERNGGKLAGFPDVIAVFPDGRVALREAKCVDAKDRLNQPQHQLADLLRALLGKDLDLKVVEWGGIA
jgi:hypothetical protein